MNLHSMRCLLNLLDCDAPQHELSIFKHDVLLRYQKLKQNTLSVGILLKSSYRISI